MLPPRTSSLGSASSFTISNDVSNTSDDNPFKITTIRFKYPFRFLNSDNTHTTPTTYFEKSNQSENDLKPTESILIQPDDYEVGGHARPNNADFDTFKSTPSSGMHIVIDENE